MPPPFTDTTGCVVSSVLYLFPLVVQWPSFLSSTSLLPSSNAGVASFVSLALSLILHRLTPPGTCAAFASVVAAVNAVVLFGVWKYVLASTEYSPELKQLSHGGALLCVLLGATVVAFVLAEKKTGGEGEERPADVKTGNEATYGASAVDTRDVKASMKQDTRIRASIFSPRFPS